MGLALIVDVNKKNFTDPQVQGANGLPRHYLGLGAVGQAPCRT